MSSGEISIMRNKTKHTTYISKGAGGETVITPIAVVLDDVTVPDTLTSWVLCHVEVLK